MTLTPLLRGLGALALTLAPGFAAADGQIYVKLFGGASAIGGSDLALGAPTGKAEYDTGFIAGGAVGYAFANLPIRAELEFAYRTGDAGTTPAAIGTGGDFASTSLMLNAIYDFDTASAWMPYIGAGIGTVTEIDFDLSGGAGEFSDRGVVAAQIMLGAAYAFNDRSAFFAELRYFDAGSVAMSGGGGTLSTDYSTLDLIAGITFSF